MTAAAGALTFETVSTHDGFHALRDGWDDVVREMPRPSAFMLHGWLDAWWMHFGAHAELAVRVARRDGRLVGVLPFCVRRRYGGRVAEFLGGNHSDLADLAVRKGEDDGVAETLVDRAASGSHDYADLFGLPGPSRLAGAARERLGVLERVEAPVLDLSSGWDAVYKAKVSSKRRYAQRRKRQKLAELGNLEVEIARTWDELEPALQDGYRLHEQRWAGRPDRSQFGTPAGLRFYLDGYRALAELGVSRVVTLKLDGRAIAFHSYLLFCECAYSDRLGFDPALGRFSPGFLNTLDWLEAAAAEGAKRVEFLGGTEEYKLVFADRFEPLHVGIGLATTARGRALAAARLASIRARRRLKRSERLRKLYVEGLAPARRFAGRLRGGANGAA